MSTFQTIQTTAGEVAAELQRRGIRPSETVTITIDPLTDLLHSARSTARVKVNASNLSDADLDALIAQARAEVAAEGT